MGQRCSFVVASSLAAAGLLLAATPRAEATITFSIAQVGPDVVVTGVGSINITGMTSFTNTVWSVPQVGTDVLQVGAGAARAYLGLSGPSLGVSSSVNATNTFGDAFGITLFNNRFYLPLNYVSGAPLFSMSTALNQSYASLHFTPGTYTYAINNGTGSDTIIINVPAPGAGCGVLLAAGATGLVRRRRR